MLAPLSPRCRRCRLAEHRLGVACGAAATRPLSQSHNGLVLNATAKNVPKVTSSALLKTYKHFSSASYSYWSMCRLRVSTWCRSSQTSCQVTRRCGTFKGTSLEHHYTLMYYTHTVLVRALLMISNSYSRFGANSKTLRKRLEVW